MLDTYYDLQLFAEEGVGGFTTAESADAYQNDGSTDFASQDTGETFESLTAKGGKYHKEFGAAVRSKINERFKNQEDNQKVIDRMSPMIALTAQRYGIKPGEDGSYDYDSIQRAMESDNSIYEREAFDRGMSVDDLREMKRLEMQNEQLRRRTENYERQQESDRQWAEIMSQAEELRQLYPDFDINVEMQNPEFGRLLATFANSGFPNPLKTTYNAIHQDEIMAGGMQYAMQKATQNAVRSIQSGSRRPMENGMKGRAASNFDRVDPSNYSLKDFDEIRKRAERGEKITF